MAFVEAMASPALTKQGVKGSDVYTEEGTGDLRLALFTSLVRGLDQNYISTWVKKIVALGPEYVRDVIVMAFQTRDVRGGKGERDLFSKMMVEILNSCPSSWHVELLRLVPEYGCWRDMWVLHPFFPSAVESVVLEQFRLDQESERPSLLAKWLPREKSQHDKLAQVFATLFFPNTPSQNGQRMRQYRRTVAFLNRLSDTTEIKMCARTWAQITPSHVPGRLLKRCKLAFFNQRKSIRKIVDRFPDNEDRRICAENFKQMLSDVKSGKTVMKGANVTMPHEHVAEIMGSIGHPGSVEEEETRQGQWDAIRAETLKGGGLGKVVAMCDFSGSMDGVPKQVSLALGILISEIASPAFKDHILTFDSEPQWHSFRGLTTLREKVESIGGLGQGLSTNFQKACDLVLQKMVENKVAPEDAPTDLLVLTDMGFDQASNHYGRVKKTSSWQTHFDMVREAFAREGYIPPRIVCWNLRAEYKDFHARANTVGVVQLSGWSPAVLKALQTKGIVVETPYMGMRRILDDERYDKVREVVSQLQKMSTMDLVRSA